MNIELRHGSGGEETGKLISSLFAKYLTNPILDRMEDGAVLPPCLDSPEKAADFYEYLLSRGVSQQDADGIFFENARTFLRKNLG